MGIPGTTIITVTVTTSVCNDCSERFGDPITTGSDRDFLVGVFVVELASGWIGVVIEGDNIRSKNRKKRKLIQLSMTEK
jgi:hypothetical protein